jgi:hypothetical protein
MSSHPFDAHSHSHSHDRLKRVYILPQDPGPPPYYFKPLMVPFEWRHLPSLPAILDPSLARIVDGYLRKTCKPDVMELAFDGDGFVHHALTQAIRDGCLAALSVLPSTTITTSITTTMIHLKRSGKKIPSHHDLLSLHFTFHVTSSCGLHQLRRASVCNPARAVTELDTTPCRPTLPLSLPVSTSLGFISETASAPTPPMSCPSVSGLAYSPATGNISLISL